MELLLNAKQKLTHTHFPTCSWWQISMAPCSRMNEGAVNDEVKFLVVDWMKGKQNNSDQSKCTCICVAYFGYLQKKQPSLTGKGKAKLIVLRTTLDNETWKTDVSNLGLKQPQLQKQTRWRTLVKLTNEKITGNARDSSIFMCKSLEYTL